MNPLVTAQRSEPPPLYEPRNRFTNPRIYLTTRQCEHPTSFNSRNTLRPSSFKRTQPLVVSSCSSRTHPRHPPMKPFVTISLIFYERDQFLLTNSRGETSARCPRALAVGQARVTADVYSTLTRDGVGKIFSSRSCSATRFAFSANSTPTRGRR